MGSLIGHVLPGIAFFLLGLWHLFNHIKLHSLKPNSYTSSPWFPTSKVRYMELYFIMVGTSISISMELFIGPSKHQPLDVDGTIPSNHLRNFEHSLISMFFFVYASFAILLDHRIKANNVKYALTLLIGAIAFGQQFFLFHLHSTDHHGLEGQYHLILQIILLVSLATTLLGIGLPKSFMVSFVRSVSIVFQGVWFIVTGYMLWTPGLIPKGCLIHNEDGHIIVRCGSQEALNRAKSLVNIEFSWFLILITIFSIIFYLGLVERYSKKVMYSSLPELQDESITDFESEKEMNYDSKTTFIHMGGGLKAFDLERFGFFGNFKKIISLSRKAKSSTPTLEEFSKKPILKDCKMQEHPRQVDKELASMRDRLSATEGERDRICNELKDMKKTAHEANGKLTEAMSNGKVADEFSELNSAIESLSRSNEELKIKELAIKVLKAEVEKAKELGTKLAEKDALIEKFKLELSKSKERIYELESTIKKGKESETEILDSFAEQTKQLEQTKILLEESKLENNSLQDEVDKLGGSPDKKTISNNGDESESLESELRLAKENEKRSATKIEGLVKEIELLKLELKQAVEAEENSKKAMDDLAFALKEVATEANQTKEMLTETKEEIDNLKKESEELKEKFRNSSTKQKLLLEEVKKEADLHRNTADRLRLEADESLQAWNDKETGFVECIRIAEDEKIAALEENTKLVEALTAAEDMNRTAKQENQKLRDILKQALNEANVAKEAAGIARAENAQLQDLLAEKDDALVFITRENENLRINEVNAMENIKELKKLLSEASGKEYKPEEKDQEHHNKLKPQNSVDKEHQVKERKLSNAFSLNLKDLIINTLHYSHDQDQKVHDKHNDIQEDDEDTDPLKGSIFDVADSPVASQTHHHHHHRRKSSTFAEDVEAIINPDDLEHIDGVHIDDVENEKNPKKKKALLRRFGDIIIRRRGVHRRESSIGGESHKKEASASSPKKESSDTTVGADQGHKKDSSIAE